MNWRSRCREIWRPRDSEVTGSIGHLPAMDAGLGSNHGSKPEVLDIMLFSFVVDLADNVNPSCSKKLFPGCL